VSADLIVDEPHQVPKITDFETIRKYQDMAEIASHFSLSYQETVELVRFRIYLAIRAGQLYAALPDDPGGRPGENSSTELTSKQRAEEALDKSRQTISQWVKMAYVEDPDVEDPYDRADEYCDRCMSSIPPLEPTLKTFYHWLFGIIASRHTARAHGF